MGWTWPGYGVAIVNIWEIINYGYNTTKVYYNIMLISPSWLLTQPGDSGNQLPTIQIAINVTVSTTGPLQMNG